MSASSVTPCSPVGRRILSLWLPRLPTDRIARELLRSGTPVSGQPRIVVAKQNNALVISALDDAAARIGLAIGQPLANARAICPDIEVFDADEMADARTLNGIADWCDRFTPLVALDPPHGLLLDITGCAHLFGGEAAMLERLVSRLRTLGFSTQGAIASTIGAAWAVAHFTPGRIVPAGREAEALRPLPVAALRLEPAQAEKLIQLGLKRIHQLFERDRKSMQARFGVSFLLRFDQALGWIEEKLDPRLPVGEYTLTVTDVPVDGFWSISMYNGAGFFEPNEWDAYSVNSVTGVRDADGSITVRFGGDPAAPNFLPLPDGWNYLVRLYRPRPEVLDGTWQFPQLAEQ